MPPARAPDDQTRVGDVHDLRAFALASDLRSLTAAARVTGESKATISRRITRLEAALGTTLLRRSSRGIAPTDEGAAYRDRVGRVLELLGDANAAAVHGASATPSGQLRISIAPGLSTALAPRLAEFCARYPRLRLVVDLSSRFVDLEAEHFDVTVRSSGKLADSALVAIRVGDPQPDGILVAAPAYLEGRPPPRRATDLVTHRFLALGDTGAPYALPLVHRGSGEALVLQLPVAIAGSDLGFLKEMALQGAGITVLPRLTVQRELDDGRLVHLLPSYAWPSASLYLLHRGGPFVPPKVRAFVDFLRAALAPEPRRRG